MAEVITNTGLQLPEHFTEEQFFEAGRFLSRIEQGMQWAIGDWYNAIEKGTGNKYVSIEGKSAACEKVGLNPKTAANYGYVANAFTISSRNEKVSFSSHARLAVDALTPDQRAELLDQAEQYGWSSARLTKERDRLLGKPEKVPLLTFNGKVDAVLESLPKSASVKVRREIKRAMDDLRHDFEKEVHHVAQERVKEQRDRLLNLEKEVEQEKEALRNLRMNLDGLMTEEEYRLIRGCLHPDRAPEDRKSQFGKAFEIFTRLERSVNRDAPVKTRRARGWA